MDTLVFSTLANPVEVDANAVLPGFALHNVIQRDCSHNYTTGTQRDRSFNLSFSEYRRDVLTIELNSAWRKTSDRGSTGVRQVLMHVNI